MHTLSKYSAALTFGTLLLLSGASSAFAAGVSAELRSATALTPTLPAGEVTATAPGGLLVVGSQPLVCDASQGFTQTVSVSGDVLALSTAGVHLPISATTVPATCGQMATDGNGTVYITQAVVDTKNTPAAARGILRETVSTTTGAVVGTGSYIATTAGLDGNQPTASAVGPDGNLYVGFLKNGTVKRVVNPGVGTTQSVQSVGGAAHAIYGMTFIGTNLYMVGADGFMVIPNAASASCTGGCNALFMADGFQGVTHSSITSDGVSNIYFTVNNQVWRFSTATGLYTLVATGGADSTGANAANFSFVTSKSNVLSLDSAGNLWIGDDTSNATAVGAGRLWTVTAKQLAKLKGGATTANPDTAAVVAALTGPWVQSIGLTTLITTFNTNGTFTTSITDSTGAITTDSGTYTVTAPDTLQPFTNPQGHLTMTDAAGTAIVSTDLLLINNDMMEMFNITDILPNTDGSIPTGAMAKQAV